MGIEAGQLVQTKGLPLQEFPYTVNISIRRTVSAKSAVILPAVWLVRGC